uniref:CAD protein n=2 Tax=Aceria tosichella TaxID=561515 RepID=A0A6G1SGQ4_9ACAR
MSSATNKAALVLSNGSIYKGQLFGYTDTLETVGEVVFQTGMVGYCQSLTDPSYHRQILVLTYPLIGNYGVLEDELESDTIWPSALVVGELSQHYSHWNAHMSLDDWMRQNKRPGLQGIDTRKLTKELRSHGTLVGMLVRLDDATSDSQLWEKARVLRTDYRDFPQSLNLVDEVSPKVERVATLNNVEFPRVLLVDCGAKNNIERCLLERGVKVIRVPWTYDIVANINSFDGIMLSNGPGDPEMCQPLIEQLKQLYSMPGFSKPIFGICLGHQLMGLAAGFNTFKLPYGNRGHNQPCRLVGTKRCLITSQNHGYALETNVGKASEEVLANWMETFVNQNDGSNEGIAHKSKPFFSVQFHPEHNAGPHDSEFLFDIFIKSIQIYLEGTNGYNQVDAIKAKLNENQSKKPENIKKVLILGSGGLSIGQAGEFDYSGSQAIKALKSEGIFTILINPNIATVQTSPTLVDRVYFLPVTGAYVTEVIKRERPDGIMLMFGGQTALNCGIELEDSGVLKEFDVQVLGPTIETIRYSEDRKLFCDMMSKIDVKVAPSCAVSSVQEAVTAANEELGYPILVRAAFALGGLGSGFADDERKLKDLVRRALVHSSQVLLDKSLKGWKELEYEVVRDIYDNCATICNMENVDPLGIHTGESIVVAPSQTLNDHEYNTLRTVAIKIVRFLGVIGECNVQYAVNPKTFEFYVIEINPRLSRSSALASKATGYPLAYVAAKLALGKSLTELANAVTSSNTRQTTACFEPSLDYCVVKIPRWDLSKFAGVTHEIGSSMKSIGEVMAIGRTFEEAFQKALRMVNDSSNGFDAFTKDWNRKEIENGLRVPTDKRIFVLATALQKDFSIEELYELTNIDHWFLYKMKNIVDLKKKLATMKLPELDLQSELFREILLQAKKMGFSDKQISTLVGGNELMIRKARCDHHNIYPFVKQVDTVSAEWPAQTNYLYLTYNASEHDIPLPDGSSRRFTTRTQSISQAQSQSPSPVKPPKSGAGTSKLAERVALANSLAAENAASGVAMPLPVVTETSQQVLVLGSGVYRIGSSVEFDCCAVGCVQQLRRMGKQVLMLNYNPETVSTDFDECHKLYFDEISFEVVMDIYQMEQPHGIVLSMGGQTPNNIALQLHNQKVVVLGTSPENIDNAEDRFKFSRMLDTHDIEQPKWKNLTHLKDAFEFCERVEYPCIVRPSYVLSGAAMNVAHTDQDLEKFLSQAIEVSAKHPVVISKFIQDAKEIDVDGVAQNGQLICMAVSEHVENAGVHSGDATLVTPPQDLNKETLEEIKVICEKIAMALEVNGPFNIQLIAKDNNLKVIECNLRVSRSFPFVSKTLNYDFIATATKVIMGEEMEPVDVAFGQHQPMLNFTSKAQKSKRVGVKVPQFSFSRLSGADIKLGVEMASTGEVACFGDNRFSAYIKALISTGFRLPERKVVLLSIGTYKQKEEFEASVITLAKMDYKIYATQGTADYYHTKLSNKLKQDNINFRLHCVEWPFGEVGSQLTTHDEIDAIAAYLSEKEFDLVINLPMRSAGTRRVSTLGYRTRRFAVDHSVPLISDMKCAKLLIEALNVFDGKQPLVTDLDCLTTTSVITLPGLFDVHVHVREPGDTQKEDFSTATAAALAGGITFIGVMPNTKPAITDLDTLKAEQELARQKARCDYGLIVGATTSNAKSIACLTSSEPIMALKMYLNTTYGTLCMEKMADWEPHFMHWPSSLPICVHAEGKTAAAAILIAQKYDKRIHICHVSSEEEITLIRHAKSLGVNVTCEVAPHHLFLSSTDCQDKALVGPKRGTVKPPLMSARDQDALWENIDVIDCFATDHAPHLIEEKLSDQSPPGFPGLETMLPLLLDTTTSSNPKRRLTIQQIVDRLYTNPKRIFNIPDQPDTSVEVDMSQMWRIGMDSPMFSRAQWTPFQGRLVRGKVIKVTLRGRVAFVDDKMLSEPGSGRDLIAERELAVFQNMNHHHLHPHSHHHPLQTLEPEPECSLEPITLRHKPTDDLLLIQQQQQQHQQPIPTPVPAHTNVTTLQYATDLRGKHVLTIDMFNDRGILRSLFNLAERYFKDDRNNRPIEQLLTGKVLGTVFFEASTRTEWSFASAMMRLGGGEKRFDQSTSSTKKGETLEDTMRVLSSYCHGVVLRHPEPGAVARAAAVCDTPIINAGDGIGEHPTQALLDVFTIRKEIGTVTDRIITLVGDLKNGRTVHSLAKLLCNYEVGEIRLVSPEGLELPEEICQHMRERHVPFARYSTLEEVIKDSDVVYMTRIQQERFASQEEYKRCAGQLKITPVFMAQNGAKDKMIVMHPLPRVDEISPEFDSDPRAAYFRQAEYGLYVRMALLTMIFA